MSRDLVRVEYAQTGRSQETDALGMRDMQARVFASRDQQYLLIKAPPASGKSRALMFLGLDKLLHQGLAKVIVAVPERAIGASFDDTDLSSQGFYADWRVSPANDLCTEGSETNEGKIKAFRNFVASASEALADRVLVCTHATLRFAFDQMHPSAFDNTLLAIDEFHHASVDSENQLGNLLDQVMRHSTAHVAAMTGSYFRGDAVPILSADDEAQFSKVTYTYYEQLNGYKYLKSLGIGYHFYQGRYTDAVHKVLDPAKKTIIHIPHPASRESTKDKYSETDVLIDAIGAVKHREPETGILLVETSDGRTLRVADLVTDTPDRYKVIEYLRSAHDRDDVDIIIALGMAKEGFDWPWCEHVLTIGYRNSMTEVVQIIGRATRDAPGKTHAQFTNLIAQPDAEDEDVKFAVNNMLKAITVSLLMEQVMAPSFNFRPRKNNEPGEATEGYGQIAVEGMGGNQPSPKVQQALDNSDDILASFLQQEEAVAGVTAEVDAEVLTQGVLERVISEQNPDLSETELEQVRQAVATQMALKTSGGLYATEEIPEGAEVINAPNGDGSTSQAAETGGEYEVSDNAAEPSPAAPKIIPGPEAQEQAEAQGVGSKQFVKVADKFVHIESLNMDLIDRVNPFQGAYEILSKSVTPAVLKTIRDEVHGNRVAMSEDEATILWPKVKTFIRDKGREPSANATDPMEQRYAQCLSWLRYKKRQREQQATGA